MVTRLCGGDEHEENGFKEDWHASARHGELQLRRTMSATDWLCVLLRGCGCTDVHLNRGGSAAEISSGSGSHGEADGGVSSGRGGWHLPVGLHVVQARHERLRDALEHADEDGAGGGGGGGILALIVLFLQNVALRLVDLREDAEEKLLRRQLPRFRGSCLVGMVEQLRPVLHRHLDLRRAISVLIAAACDGRDAARGEVGGSARAPCGGGSLVHSVKVIEEHECRVRRVDFLRCLGWGGVGV
eukprot:scaffold3836_cov125-Isochrysis_galbana.AAC.8